MFLGSTNAPIGEAGGTRSNSPAILGTIPSGPSGTVATLRIMRDAARASVRSPDQIVRRKAEELTAGLPPRAWTAEIRALHEYVRDSIRYLRDPVTVERVQTPEETIKNMQGDCDDKATLLAALLDSIGHPAQFVAIGLNGGGFSHVLVETRVGSRMMPLETIIQKEAGWWPDGVTKAYRLGI